MHWQTQWQPVVGSHVGGPPWDDDDEIMLLTELENELELDEQELLELDEHEELELDEQDLLELDERELLELEETRDELLIADDEDGTLLLLGHEKLLLENDMRNSFVVKKLNG